MQRKPHSRHGHLFRFISAFFGGINILTQTQFLSVGNELRVAKCNPAQIHDVTCVAPWLSLHPSHVYRGIICCTAACRGCGPRYCELRRGVRQRHLRADQKAWCVLDLLTLTRPIGSLRAATPSVVRSSRGFSTLQQALDTDLEVAARHGFVVCIQLLVIHAQLAEPLEKVMDKRTFSHYVVGKMAAT